MQPSEILIDGKPATMAEVEALGVTITEPAPQAVPFTYVQEPLRINLPRADRRAIAQDVSRGRCEAFIETGKCRQACRRLSRKANFDTVKGGQLTGGRCRVLLGSPAHKALARAGIRVFEASTTIGQETFGKGDALAVGRAQCRAMRAITNPIVRARFEHCKPSGTLPKFKDQFTRDLNAGTGDSDGFSMAMVAEDGRGKLRNAAKRRRQGRA